MTDLTDKQKPLTDEQIKMMTQPFVQKDVHFKSSIGLERRIKIHTYSLNYDMSFYKCTTLQQWLHFKHRRSAYYRKRKHMKARVLRARQIRK